MYVLYMIRTFLDLVNTFKMFQIKLPPLQYTFHPYFLFTFKQKIWICHPMLRPTSKTTTVGSLLRGNTTQADSSSQFAYIVDTMCLRRLMDKSTIHSAWIVKGRWSTKENKLFSAVVYWIVCFFFLVILYTDIYSFNLVYSSVL